MPRVARELSAIEVRRLTAPEGRGRMVAVGGVAGLYLQLLPTGAKTWILRTRIGDKTRDRGLGGAQLSDMTLSATMRRMHEAEVEAGRKGWLDPRSVRPAVPHGLRSTFRDWAAETGQDHIAAELALAHSVGSDVERAYRRSDMVARRRAMMSRWAGFLQRIK